MLSEIVAWLAPPACVSCNAPCSAAATLCAGCRAAVPWLVAARCRRCGLPSPCAPCPAIASAFDAAWSATAYDGVARVLVQALKFRGRLAAADVMAAQIAANAPRALLSGTLVPVAGDPGRSRRRGFDHAAVLARALASRTGMPLAQRLLRAPALPRQLGAGRGQRLRRGRVAFEVDGPPPTLVVLIDDVHTTGATLHACASALRRAGSDRIVALTYARTLR